MSCATAPSTALVPQSKGAAGEQGDPPGSWSPKAASSKTSS